MLTWMQEAAAQGCGLARLERDTNGDGVVDEVETPTPAGERDCLNADCSDYTETLPTIARAWTQADPLFPDHWRAVLSGRRVMEAGQERWELRLVGQVNGSSALQTVERIYGAQGKLLYDRHTFNNNLWFETENVWLEGRLMESTHYDHVNGSGNHRLTFLYDGAGRLSRAASVDLADPDTVQQTAEWSYDAQGHPASVVRTQHGEPLREQRWHWEDDHLVNRTVTQHARGDGPYLPLALDDFAAVVTYIYEDYDWRDAEFRQRAGAQCHLPPTSLSHGYPKGEGLWELGWTQAERPGGIGFDYGYDGYAFFYGETAWFGHGGVGAHYALGYGDTPITDTVLYDSAGRMSSERVESTDVETGQPLEILRHRSYVDELLESDTLEVSTAQDTWTSTLRFTYEQGRLTGRHWQLGDHDAATHTWDYDAAGKLMAHDIGFLPHLQTSAAWGVVRPPPPAPALERVQVTWEQEWNDEATVMVRNKYFAGELIGVENAYRWSALEAGTLTERDGSFELVDAQGRMVSYGYGPFDAPSYRYTRDFDDAGLLSHWTYHSESSGTEEAETYLHVCE